MCNVCSQLQTFSTSCDLTQDNAPRAFDPTAANGVAQTTLTARAPMATPGQLADYLTTGFWGGQERSFDTDASNVITVNLTDLTADGVQLARWAMEAWEMVADVEFAETRGRGDIVFDDVQPGASGGGTIVGDTITSAHVNVSTDWLDQLGTTIDSHSFQTYIHEIGHALGLGHQGAYNGGATYGRDETFANDSLAVSVMSYFSQTDNTSVDASFARPISTQMADIIAIQSLYGAPDASSATAGNTIWGGRWTTLDGYLKDFFQLIGTGGSDGNLYSNDPVTFTIYDRDGTDLIDLGASTSNDRFDMNAGTFSDVYRGKGNVAIAVGTQIENLYTGSGNDTVAGNAVSNSIFTAAGHDRVDAGAGFDTVAGGSGNDTLNGEGGDDRLWGGNGHDALNGGAGDDTLGGGGGNDDIRGLNGDDRLWGGGGSDAIHGGQGGDTVGGGEGNDRINGDDGDDQLLGGGGSDVISGGNDNDDIYGDGSIDTLHGDRGNDTLDGGNYGDLVYGDAGDDLVDGGEGNDQVFGGAGNDEVRGGTQADSVFGDAGDDRLFGEQGWDVLNGGTGNDTLTGGSQGDTFVFRDGDGADVITDFNIGERDRLSLDDGLWGGASLSARQVLDRFGGADAAGDLVLDFGGGDRISLTGIDDSTDLTAALGFF